MSPRQFFINQAFKFIAILENTGDFIFREVGLTVKTYWVLFLISTGLDTSKDLLSGTYGSKPNMTKKLRHLEDGGFITRNIDAKDKRIYRFRMTPKAVEAIEKIAPLYEASTSLIFSGISDADIATWLHVLEVCLENLHNCPKKL